MLEVKCLRLDNFNFKNLLIKFLKDYIAGFMVKVHPSNFSQTGRDILCILILESNVEDQEQSMEAKGRHLEV